MAMLTTDRVRTRLDGLAAAGLDLSTFGMAAIDLLSQALPFSAACLAPADPATELVTGTGLFSGGRP